jgi:hypothetical protein
MVGQNLYTLKRQYGGSAVLCCLLDADTDYQTGSKTVEYRFCSIPRLIVLPSRIMRDVIASVARISVNKPLAYGGQFQVGDRGFIIDGRDIPAGWEVKQDDWILYRGGRYSIKTVLRVCGNTGWAIVARKHSPQALTFHVAADSPVRLAGEAVS